MVDIQYRALGESSATSVLRPYRGLDTPSRTFFSVAPTNFEGIMLLPVIGLGGFRADGNVAVGWRLAHWPARAQKKDERAECQTAPPQQPVQDTTDGNRCMERTSAEVNATEEQDQWHENIVCVSSLLTVIMADRDCRTTRIARPSTMHMFYAAGLRLRVCLSTACSHPR
jgi:hypothetical protein